MILSSVFHCAVSKTSKVLDMLPMQLKLSICHPLTASVTLAHSGGGDGGRGDSDGKMGSRAAKSNGNHSGEKVLGFDEPELMIMPVSLCPCQVKASRSNSEWRLVGQAWQA